MPAESRLLGLTRSEPPVTAPPDMPRWGVTATIDEPSALTAAFVAHHLAVGAAEVHVFLDRPNPATEALLAGIAGVVVHHDGEDGWTHAWRNKRPERVEGRQKYNATRVLRETGLDWLVHCDADEFVWPIRPLGRELARVSVQKHWLKLTVAERVYRTRIPAGHVFDGVFRTPWRDRAAEGSAAWGASAAYLNGGLSGHTAGKPVVRAGQGYAMGVHFPLRDYHKSVNDIPYRPSDSACLLHFDGLTPLHYILKMLRRVTTEVKGDPVPYGDARTRQFTAMAARAADPRAMADLWWQVQGVCPNTEAALSRAGLIEPLAPDIPGAVQALFGNRVDLSPEAFDAALLHHEAPLIARLRARFGFDPEALTGW